VTVFVIAEAGVNHNGQVDMALRLVDAAAAAGADAVKFQTFRAEALAAPGAPMAAYQNRTMGNDESQLAMLRALELSTDAHRAVVERCCQRQIRFLSTPFDLGSLDFLVRDLAVDRLKIGSGDLTNAPLLLAASRSGLPIILSTGMATMEEIAAALGILAFGYISDRGWQPSRPAFSEAFASPAGTRVLKEKVTLLHCTTEYPAPPEEANLRALLSLRQAFDLAVGFSDHTAGIAVATAAVALGAVTIEKHLTLDRSLKGPDHAASLEPGEFKALVDAVRTIEVALGDGEKRPAPSEIKNKVVARKSLVARTRIAKGERFTAENLGTLRPGNGVSALDYFDWLDRPANRDYAPGEAISS